MLLKNKVAIVTGGASGLGLCFVKDLLKNGLKGVTIADIDSSNGHKAVASLEKEYGSKKVEFFKLDVKNKQQFEDVIKTTVGVFGCFDILINSAGITNERKMDDVIDINLKGTMIGTVLAMDEYLPKYRSSDESVVVNISSIFGLEGCEAGCAYAATKHGVIGLGKSLSTKAHYKSTGVKILTLCPGFTQTPIVTKLEDSVRPGRYQDMLKDLVFSAQKPEVVSMALLKILENFENGSTWVIEDNELYQVEIPERQLLKRKNFVKLNL